MTRDRMNDTLTADAPQPYKSFNAWMKSGLLTAAAVVALATLVADTEPGADRVYSSVPELARRMGVSVSATRRRLATLSRHRVIAQTQRGTKYQLSQWRFLSPPRPY